MVLCVFFTQSSRLCYAWAVESGVQGLGLEPWEAVGAEEGATGQ